MQEILVFVKGSYQRDVMPRFNDFADEHGITTQQVVRDAIYTWFGETAPTVDVKYDDTDVIMTARRNHHLREMMADSILTCAIDDDMYDRLVCISRIAAIATPWYHGGYNAMLSRFVRCAVEKYISN